MIYAQHFDAEEFREWSDDMSAHLVTMLDVLRLTGRQYELQRDNDHSTNRRRREWIRCGSLDRGRDGRIGRNSSPRRSGAYARNQRRLRRTPSKAVIGFYKLLSKEY